MSKSTPIHSINVDFSNVHEATILFAIIDELLRYPTRAVPYLSGEMREYLEDVKDDLDIAINLMDSVSEQTVTEDSHEQP